MRKTLLLCALLQIALIVSASSCNKEGGNGSGSSWEDILGSVGDKNDGEISKSVYRLAGCTDAMKAKAGEWRAAACTESTRNGAYVYSVMVKKYADAPEKLAARLFVLGFKDVYLSCNKSMLESCDRWLTTFIKACHKSGMKVYAVRISNNTLLLNPSEVDSEVALVLDYNKAVFAAERYDGINADLEVHTAKEGRVPGLEYVWDSKNNFGVGRDNDQLLKIGLDVLTRAGKRLHQEGLVLSEAISYSYQSHFDAGELSYGSTPQFLNCCDYVVIMAYLSTMESIWSKSEPVLKASDTPASVSIAYKTAMNNVDSPSLRPKGWEYLLETSRYLNTKGRAYPSYRGIDVFTYEGLEIMWEE